MKIQFLGAAHEVTGSATLITVANKKILVDYGMEQGIDIYANCDLPIAPADIDCVFLTHAHIDHSGMIPKLVKNGFSGEIYTTVATEKLCRIMLMDSAHIQEFEAEWRNRKAKRSGDEEYEPVYTQDDVTKTIPLFVPCRYDIDYKICDCISVKFIDAGHLLGSASVELTLTENGEKKTVLFSGDVGNTSRPLIRDPQKPENADIVIIESTYGDRLHGERPDYVSQLTSIIQRTFDRGGNVVIPCFAVGRTQEMLYLIRQIKHDRLIKNHDNFPVWVDSPLAVEATGIYSEDLTEFFDSETLDLPNQGINPIRFPNLNLSVTSDESKFINADPTPKIILSASGMCEAGRIRHHLKHNLWRRECTVLFVGYQSEGTLGAKLLDGAAEIKLFGETVAVNAEIAQMDRISGHADRDMLLNWLQNISPKPQKVYVNHGADTVCDSFASLITEKLGVTAEAPYNEAVYDLNTGELLLEGNRERIVKFKPKESRANTVFRRLLDAGRRLLTVIEHNRGGANKDLAKFADQINALCDKWDR